MLESELKKLTTAVIEMTAALESKSGSAPSTQGTTKDTAPVEVQTPTPETTLVVSSEPAPVMKPKAILKKQLVEKFIELAQSKDREVAVKLLADFGVSKLPELTDKSKWPEFIDAVDILLAG